MQIQKSLTLLKKINALFQSIVDHSDSVSRLEADLLKSYVIEFYDSITHEESQHGSTSQDSHARVETIVPTNPEEVEDLEPNVQPVETETKSVEETPYSSEEDMASDISIADDQNHLDELIEEMERSQLSSHIGEKFVTDIRKSMGLNDKLLFANSLFNGNQSKLLEFLDQVNSAESFEDATGLLRNVAKSNEWSSDSRRQSAVKLLHLINLKFKSR